ncbi:hypothetical protein QTP88_014585 [Uroleucon formosanum]
MFCIGISINSDGHLNTNMTVKRQIQPLKRYRPIQDKFDVRLINVNEASSLMISKTVQETETHHICRVSSCRELNVFQKNVLMKCLLLDNRHVFFSPVNPR